MCTSNQFLYKWINTFQVDWDHLFAVDLYQMW